MNRFLTLFAVAVSTVAMTLAVQSTRHIPRQIAVGGKEFRTSIQGQVSPAVVFDTFGPGNLEIWNQVQPQVARFTRTFSYDHGGYWGSEPGPKPRDARRLALELRGTLQNAGVAPPFVLVGFSMGGIYARVFAATFPETVAGIVFIDPTTEDFMAWFAKRFPEMNRVSEQHLLAQDELASIWHSFSQAREAQLPDIPLTLITGMKTQDPLTRRILPVWLEKHRTWLMQYPHAKHIITTNSGHEIVLSEPHLAVDAIREMVENIRERK